MEQGLATREASQQQVAHNRGLEAGRDFSRTPGAPGGGSWVGEGKEAGPTSGAGAAPRRQMESPGGSLPRSPQGPDNMREEARPLAPQRVTSGTTAPRGLARLPLYCAGRKSSGGSQADIKPSHCRPQPLSRP